MELCFRRENLLEFLLFPKGRERVSLFAEIFCESEMHHRPEHPRRSFLLWPQAFEVVEAVLLRAGQIAIDLGMREV